MFALTTDIVTARERELADDRRSWPQSRCCLNDSRSSLDIMSMHDDLPTDLARLVEYVASLSPEDIHVHLPSADERMIQLPRGEKVRVPMPEGWFDYAKSEGFADGMKQITALMRATIFVVRDHQRMVNAVAQLVQVAAAQQAQIEELRVQLDEVRNARVAVAAQKVAADMIDRLTDKGTATEQVEVIIRHREQESHSSVERKVAERDRHRRTDVRGKIGGLAKLLASLDAKADIGEAEIARELEIATETSSQTRNVDLTFKLNGVQPSSDPKSHAEAFLARRQFEVSQQAALPDPSRKSADEGTERSTK